MSDDVLITPASRKIEFKDNSGNVDGKIELDSSGNLKITSPGGGLELGDAASDIYVGNGSANIDIIFEQNGEIRGTTGRTLTLGQSDSNISIDALNFTVLSTDAGATAKPDIRIYRNSSSPADFDDLGQILFIGRNDNSQDVTYGKINSEATDVSDGGEDAYMRFYLPVGGTERMHLRLGYEQTEAFGRLLISPGSVYTNPTLIFEGSTSDTYETSIVATDPTADRTLTLPNVTGTFITTANADAPSTTTEISNIDHFLINDGGVAKKITPANFLTQNNVLTTSNSAIPTTTTSSGDADHVLVNDGGTLKKIPPANLGIGGGGGGSTAADDLTAGDAAVNLTTTSGNITIDAQGSDTDIIFKGTDGSSDRTFLTLDGSNLGAATFGGSVIIGTNDLIVDTDTLFVDASADNVGIGTTSPTYELDIRSTSRTRLNMQDGGNSEASIIFQNSSGLTIFGLAGTGDILNSTTLGDFVIGCRTGGDIIFSADQSYAQQQFVIKEDGKIGIGTDSPSSELEVVGDLTLLSTDAGATENPTLDLYRNSASPADGDVLGHIDFSGENSAGEKIVYAKINADIGDVTDGTEDARLDFGLISNGSFSGRIFLQGNGTTDFLNKDVRLSTGVNLKFEGATNNEKETTLTVVDPTADRTITFPNATGTVLTTGNSNTPTTTTSSSDADFVLVDDGGTMKKITPSNLGISGGGGASNLNGLSDVTISSVANNDLLKYNSTAGEWQNTNLGLTVTPTLSLATSVYYSDQSAFTVNVTNHDTYDFPAYSVEVRRADTNALIFNMSSESGAQKAISIVTDDQGSGANSDGRPTGVINVATLQSASNFDTISTDNFKVLVIAQDFGDLQSEVATLNVSVVARPQVAFTTSTYRYWRVTDMATRQYMTNWRAYSAINQGGTEYPGTLTSTNNPTNKFSNAWDSDSYTNVAKSNFAYSVGYTAIDPFDNSTTSSGFWTLGPTTTSNWTTDYGFSTPSSYSHENILLVWDMGVARQIKSMEFKFNDQFSLEVSSGDNTFIVQGSNDESSWTTVCTVSASDQDFAATAGIATIKVSDSS